jgi:hypothetical protein
MTQGNSNSLHDGSRTTYSNARLGFRYAAPPGLVDRTEPFKADIQEQAKASGTTNMLNAILAMSSGGDDSSPDWGSVTIESYPRKSVSERDDLKAEVQMSAWVAHSRDTSAPPKSTVISGQRFSVSLFATQQGPIRKGAVVWTTIRRGELLSFAFAANSPKQLKILAESMKTLQFFE